jgi:hypothetical protein
MQSFGESKPVVTAKSSEMLKAEIQAALGFIPTFFEPAFAHPTVFQSLWEQTRLSYIGNPLPALFKEQVAALLSRFCSVSYCLIAHSSWLHEFGMKPKEILELLERDVLEFDVIEENIKWMGNKSIETWPEPGSQLETSLFSCCVSIFIEHEVSRAYGKLRALLGDQWFNHLVELISWKRATLNWIESHPELSAEDDERVKRHLSVILKEEPRLRDYFQNYREIVGEQIDKISLSPVRETKKIVSREKQTSERLKAVLDRFELVSSGFNLGSLTCDLTSLELHIDETFRRHLRLPLDEDLGASTVAQYLDETIREAAVVKCRQAISSGEILRLRFGSIYLLGWATYSAENRPQVFEMISFDAQGISDHKFGSAISIG